MADNTVISPEWLRQMIAYDPNTGELRWRERVPEDFPFGAARSQESYCEAWNKQFAGKPCFDRAHPNGYLMGAVKSQRALAHRVAWAIYHGRWPTMIDHINGDKRDNRIKNLRQVTPRENARNLPLPSKSKTGVIGVTKEGRRYRARTSRSKIGVFDTLEEAAQARAKFNEEHDFHPNHGKRAPYRPPS